MRIVAAATMLTAVLLPGAAEAADCGALKIVDRIQMERTPANVDLIPVTLNGQAKKFIFSSSDFGTNISKKSVTDLGLHPIANSRLQTIQLGGNRTNEDVTLKQFQFGHMLATDVFMNVSPDSSTDGTIALDVLRANDIDVDFGTDIMNMFSTDHCPGQIVYWKAPAVVAAPIIWADTFSMRVRAMMDGHEVIAEIATGTPDTIIYSDRAQSFYNLNPGDPGMEEKGALSDGEKTYEHVFKSLVFGGTVTVNNPHVIVWPRLSARTFDHAPLVGDRAKSERDLFDVPDMVIGMNVLRKLHMYIAMNENKLYFSDATGVTHAADAPSSPAQ
jgi:hypothetical protein